MVDTWNPAQINEAIKNGSVGGSSSELPEITPSDYGSFLAVDEDGEWGLDTPKSIPDYSTTETATGQKWIDGRDIYAKTYTGSITTNYQTIDADFNGQNEIIKADAYVSTDAGGMSNGYISSNWCCAVSYNTSQFLNIYTGSGLSEGTYKVTVYYVKPAEPEAAKTTKKKTTK